jgi:hypothetical protein
MKRAEIRGDGWSVFVSRPLMAWDFDGDSGYVAARMLNDHYSREELSEADDSVTIYGREFGMLYPRAAEFLNKWGIKCEVVGLGPILIEAPPPAD